MAYEIFLQVKAQDMIQTRNKANQEIKRQTVADIKYFSAHYHKRKIKRNQTQKLSKEHKEINQNK